MSSKKTLLVVVPDRISDILRKGEYAPRYYNPGDVFDEVHLLLTNDDCPDPAQVQYTVGRAQLYVHNLPPPTFIRTLLYRPWLMRSWTAAAITLARQINPDIIRGFGVDLQLFLAGEIKRALNIPLIVSLHGNPDVDYMRQIHHPLKRLVYWLRQQTSRRALKDVDHFVAVYTPIISFFQRYHLTNYSVIYNVVGVGAVPKTDYSLDENNVRCICVGRQVREQKDQRPILYAVKHLPQVKLYLYGNGDLHEALVALAQELGITDRVVFDTGVPNTRLMQELHEFDLYLYNSINYEISKTVIEAALIGLPVIHNQRPGGLSEELSGDYIYKVENTPEGYQQGILALINNPELRSQLGQTAREYARQHWSPETTEQQYVDLYRKWLNSSAGQG